MQHPEDLEKRASLLLAAAHIADHPARRQKLVSDAHELRKRASLLRSGIGQQEYGQEIDAVAQAPPAAARRLWLFGSGDEVLWLEFTAMNRAEAVWAAEA